MKKRKLHHITVFAIIAMACFVTLVGVVTGLDPDKILTRSMIACALIGISFEIGLRIISSLAGKAN